MEIIIAANNSMQCVEFYENTARALMSLKKKAEVSVVREEKHIAELGVQETPALIIDGAVKSSGRILSVREIKHIIRQA